MGKTIIDYYNLNEEKYQCLFCGRCFLNVCDIKVLANHLKKSHISQESNKNKLQAVFENSHSCADCGYKSTHKSNIVKHKRSVHEGVKYPCNKCNFKASSEGSLRRHNRLIHEFIHKDM